MPREIGAGPSGPWPRLTPFGVMVSLTVVVTFFIGGLILLSRYQAEMRTQHYARGIEAIENREWDVAVTELKQARDYLDAEQKLAYGEEQLGRLIVLYNKGMERFKRGEYWEAAWWLRQAADMHPNYKDTNEKLGTAREHNGKILFTRKDASGERQELWIMEADGANQRLIFSAPEGESMYVPRIRPGVRYLLGRTYAYDYESQRDLYSLWIVDLEGSPPTQLASKAYSVNGNISKDGTRILFWVQYWVGYPGTRSLIVSDSRGQEMRTIATGVLFGFFATSSGEKILFSQPDPEAQTFSIYLTDLSGSQRQDVFSGRGTGYAYLSPDLNHMVIVELLPTGGFSLYAANASGGELQEVISDNQADLLVDPWYSEDGKRFIFGVRFPAASACQFYRANAQGTDLEPLSLELSGCPYPEFSPTLDYALYIPDIEGTIDSTRLHIVEITSGKDIEITASAGEVAFWSFSRDGRKIVYPERASDGSTTIYVANVDGTGRQVVAYDADAPIWIWPK